MPVYNEKETIEKIVKRVLKNKVVGELIIVDDFSTDGTREILRKISKKEKKVKLIFHSRNYGKGRAIRSGLGKIKEEIVIIQDADLEYNPGDYEKLLKPIFNNKADVVYGSRFLGKKPRFSVFYFGNMILVFFANLLYNAEITDEATCYKVFKTKILREMNLKCRRFEFCPEVTAKLRKQGYKIFEVPVSYNARSIREGKKIKWRDGFIALWTLIKYRFAD